MCILVRFYFQSICLFLGGNLDFWIILPYLVFLQKTQMNKIELIHLIYQKLLNLFLPQKLRFKISVDDKFGDLTKLVRFGSLF